MGIPTKVPIDLVNPTPAAASETTTALNSKANSSDLSSYVTLASAQTISGSKTISSDLNLQPSSSSANTGGKINFHYNQASSATSSIYEDASGRIRLDGNLYLNGDIVNTITSTSSVPIRFFNMDSSSQAEQRLIQAYEDRGSTEVGEVLFYTTTNSGEHSVRLRAFNAGTYADLVVGVKSDGTKYTTTFTPATNDNSTKIATTAFVNNRLPYETGTWTPELKGTSTAGTFNYTTRMGYYIKIGQLIYINAAFNAKCTSVPSGNLRIYGLPFVAHQYTNGGNIIINETSNNSLGKARFCRVQDNGSFMSIYGEDLSNSFRRCVDLVFSSSDTANGVICQADTELSIRLAGVYYSSN